MEAAAPVTATPALSAFNEQQVELLLDALKAGLATPGEHRLFRWGKHRGLFPSRVGLSGETATAAVREGLLTIVRTETKGKVVVEWVRVSPAGVAFVHDRDSPKAVLRELRVILDTARAGVPVWMVSAREEIATLSAKFEQRASELLARLDSLTERVEAALRRSETASPTLTKSMTELVPWGVAALEYLDQRKAAKAAGDCPLPELFQALIATHPDLTLAAFQDGLRHLAEVRALRLAPAEPSAITEPEYAFVIDGMLVWGIAR
jgi:hypothetical protein